VEIKKQYQAKYQTGLQRWKTRMAIWMSTSFDKVLEYENFIDT